ncbi:hypothetical protein KEM54_000125 [Ascosphaera aggregata]|nr:hypothetical protein KEM54_000125 [Ascosphaera aggregata]
MRLSSHVSTAIIVVLPQEAYGSNAERLTLKWTTKVPTSSSFHSAERTARFLRALSQHQGHETLMHAPMHQRCGVTIVINLRVLSLFSFGLAQNVGTFLVQNNCQQNITVKQVDSLTVGNLLQNLEVPDTIPANEFRSYPWSDSKTGVSMLVAKDTDDLTKAVFTRFAYIIKQDGSKDQLTYSLSDLNGDPFVGNQVLLATSTGACPEVNWPNGTPVNPGEEHSCSPDNSLTLTLCADFM